MGETHAERRERHTQESIARNLNRIANALEGDDRPMKELDELIEAVENHIQEPSRTTMDVLEFRLKSYNEAKQR